MATGADSGAFGEQLKYYDGFVEKKTAKEKDYSKVYCIIHSNKFCYYPQKVTFKEQEKTEPTGSMILDHDQGCKITMKDKMITLKSSKSSLKEVKLKFNTVEERDGWYIRLFTIVCDKPPDMPLMPGQKQICRDIMNSEQLRKGFTVKKNVSRTAGSTPQLFDEEPASPPPPTPMKTPKTSLTPTPKTSRSSSTASRGSFDLSGRDPLRLCPVNYSLELPFPPSWFFGKIPRHHADEILKNNTAFGDILVRNSESVSGADQFSLSVRQNTRDGNVIVRHYKLKRELYGRYKLDIDEDHIATDSVYELLLFFIEKSGGHLRLFESQDPTRVAMPSNLYENRFSQVLTSDPENGEHGVNRRGRLPAQGSFISRQPIVLPSLPSQPPPIQETDYLTPNQVQVARTRSVSLPATQQPNMTMLSSSPRRKSQQHPEEEEYIQPTHRYANVGNNPSHAIPERDGDPFKQDLQNQLKQRNWKK